MAKSPATAGTRKPSKAEQAKLAAAAKANLENPSPDVHVITDEQRKADAQANEAVKADAFSQFVAQGNGTAPALGTPPAAMEGFTKALEALKAQYGVIADVKVKPAKADKKVQNDVTRPAEDTTCGKIWATADAISAATHSVCAIAALKEHPDMKGINDHTLKTQYSKWRQFNGIVGRLPKIHAVHQVAGEYAGLKPIEPTKS